MTDRIKLAAQGKLNPEILVVFIELFRIPPYGESAAARQTEMKVLCFTSNFSLRVSISRALLGCLEEAWHL